MHGSCSMKCASELHCCALLLNEMMEDGVDPNAFTYSSALKACAQMETVLHWKLIHSSANKSPVMSNVFDSMPEWNLVSWKAMIVVYAKNGLCQEAMKLMYRMRTEGFEVDDCILAIVLTECGDLLIYLFIFIKR
ncbi:PREDICTED: pentatricopeptide [Prunus dulcis]|uniref:PREDICTED: pentatricopeptide n=1 Tax=Prunus dulcis TaxID=3755 RepID=A0A5E4FML1_PRUDU|nr:PREDICTED: pentatricopeptide [Prunus dulcis]